MSVYKKPHKLRGIKTTSYPYHFIFVDTETHTHDFPTFIEHEFRLGWACYWRREKKKRPEVVEWFYFTSTKDFWEWVFTKVEEKSRLIIISHNVPFDFTVLCPWVILAERGYTLKTLIVDSQINILRYRREGHTIMIIDNINFFKHSLKWLGAMLGVEKLEVDHKSVSDEELSIYCQRDVEILLKTWRYLSDFILSEDLGGFAPTVASLAFRCFEHRFMTHDIFIHNNEEVMELERRSYHGGRTEAFRLGDLSGEDWYVVDVNSMYPSVMYENEYPTKLIGHGTGLSVNRLSELLGRYLVIADVIVNTEVPCFAINLNDHLIFPVGRFRLALATPELIYAQRNGMIESVGEYSLYAHAPIFKKYVSYWWRKKSSADKSKNEVMRLFYKLMLNSLYGKFAQRNRVLEYVGRDPSFEFKRERWCNGESGETGTLIYFGGGLFEERERAEGFDSFVAIASHVTSYARMLLWEALQQAGMENVVYCDTDSLFLNKVGFEKLYQSGEGGTLGAWGLKGQTSNLMVFGVKDYIFEDTRVMKGIRKQAREISPGVFEQEQWPSFRGMLEAGGTKNYQTKIIQKHVSRDYFKRAVLDGGETLPIRLALVDGENIVDMVWLDQLGGRVANKEILLSKYGNVVLS
ncbi:MAG: hypothetical protein DDT19_01774 [Syntrophomonadaceae bacterium]|nr:hypothetical protein [Bacillota bacterium]